METPSPGNSLLKEIKDRILSLREDHRRILQLEKSVSEGKVLTKEEEELISTKYGISDCVQLLETIVPDETMFAPFCRCPSKGMPCPNVVLDNMGKGTNDPLDKGRYLCVSDGFTLTCFDLKLSMDVPHDYCSAVEKTPLRYDLHLEEEGFPFSYGLFKVGSVAFMVGGLASLGKGPGVCPSTKIFHLHLHSNRRLSLSTCHHTLILEDHSNWIEYSPLVFPGAAEEGIYISSSHIVVHDMIYARDTTAGRLLVFDSINRTWEARAYERNERGLCYIKHVGEILPLGFFGCCVGQILPGAFKESVYLVLAFGCDQRGDKLAVAYLVRSNGQVLCFQRLNRFFEGFLDFPVLAKWEGTATCGEQGNTIAVVLRGNEYSLFFTSFTWELDDGAFDLIPQLLLEKGREAVNDLEHLPPVDEEEFICVVGQSWYKSTLGATSKLLGCGLGPTPLRLSSCFI